eukprot:3623779-Rhodomonas_salina.2
MASHTSVCENSFIDKSDSLFSQEQTMVSSYCISVLWRRLKCFCACERTCAAVRDPIISASMRAPPGPSRHAPS